jgi:hypothetical protein
VRGSVLRSTGVFGRTDRDRQATNERRDEKTPSKEKRREITEKQDPKTPSMENKREITEK